MKGSVCLWISVVLCVATIAGAADKEIEPLKKLPIIYSDEYNISFLGLENLHPFDSKKYGRVFEKLEDRIGLKEAQVYEPEMITDEELLAVHNRAYLESLESSSSVARIAEMGILSILYNSGRVQCPNLST